MKTRLSVAAALAASVLLVAGCAAESAPEPAAPSSTPEPSAVAETPPVSDDADFEAAWLDDGRFFAVVTWGSSTCVPVVDTAEAEGQTVTVTFVEEDAARPCTADYAPRASIAPLPEGVDPTEDVQVIATLGEATMRTELDGDDDLRGAAGSSTEFAPSAGWFDEHQLVLLTWGSSSCPPVVSEITEASDAATVTFADDHDDDFVLTLTGGGFDNVQVRPID